MLATVLGIGQIFSWGTLWFAFPLIAVGMEAQLGWSKEEIYLGVTISMLMTAAVSYPVGLGIDRGYGRWILAGSSAAILPVLLSWSLTDKLSVYYVISACNGVLQAALLYEPAFAVQARRVGARNARAGITRITLWGGFASTVFIPLAAALIDAWGWRTTLMILGVMNALYALCYLAAINPRKDVEYSADDEIRAAHAARNHQAIVASLHNRVFWALLLALTTYAGLFAALAYHMYPMFESKGLSNAEVVIAMAMIGPAQVLGRILITWLAGSASLRLIGMWLVAAFPVIFLLMYPAQIGFIVLTLLCVVYGLVNGTFTIVRSFMVPELLSAHAYGAINGMITVCATLARAGAPLAAAWVWAFDASYQPVVLLLVGLSVVLMLSFWLAVWLARHPKRRTDVT